jgi:hypothetical protein
MKNRERMIAIVAGGIVALSVLYFVVDAAVVSPIADRKQRAASLREKIRQIQPQVEMGDVYERRLIAWAQQTFPGDREAAANDFRERLARLLLASNLAGDLKSGGGASRRGAYNEIIWRLTVPAGGGGGVSLDEISGLLYLLQNEPYLCHVENVRIEPVGRRSGSFRLSAQLSTIVLDVANIDKFVPASGPAVDVPGPPVESPGFEPYAVIASRNVFQPYQPPPPARPQPRPQPQPQHQPQPQPQPQPPAGSRFHVVSLTEWQGQPEVWVVDNVSGNTRRYKPGDELAGGEIVMIDYRPLPRPDKPELNSPSRVILKVLDRYYAIELNQTIDRKRRLSDEQLPEQLRGEQPASDAADEGARS